MDNNSEKYYLLDEWADKLGLPRGTEFNVYGATTKSSDKVVYAYLQDKYLHARPGIAFKGFWTPQWAYVAVYPDGALWAAPGFRVAEWLTGMIPVEMSIKISGEIYSKLGQERRKYKSLDDAEIPLSDRLFKILGRIK